MRREAEARIAAERSRLETEAARAKDELRRSLADATHGSSEGRAATSAGEVGRMPSRAEEVIPDSASAAAGAAVDDTDSSVDARPAVAATTDPSDALMSLQATVAEARTTLERLERFRSGVGGTGDTDTVIDSMHLRIDGTKNYTISKTRLSSDAAKTYNEKIDGILDSVARDLADILIRDFFSVFTSVEGIIHVGGTPLAADKAPLSELVRKFIHRSADRTLWARLSDSHANAEIISRRRVALGLGIFVLGVLKPDQISSINDQDSLKNAIKGQLWLKDLSFIIAWMKNALVPQDYKELYGTKSDETRDEKVADEIRLMLNGIPERRALASFGALGGNRFLVRR